MLTVRDRKLLKIELHHGSMKKIARQSGVTTASISKWFAGRTNSERIERAVFDELLKQKAEREDKLRIIGML